MVFDTLSQADTPTRIDPRLVTALAWLARFDPAPPAGRYAIEGEAVFASVQSYEVATAGHECFEAHRSYVDIQYLLPGTEVKSSAPLGEMQAMTNDDPQHADQFFADPVFASAFRLRPGSFAVNFPQDAHKPGCSDGPESPVKKVVINVRIS